MVTDHPVPGLAVRRGQSETVIRAPLEALARPLTDFGHYTEVIPRVRESRVVHRQRAATDVYLQVPMGESLGVLWSLARMTVRRSPGRVEIEGHAIDGNLDRFESLIVLERVPGPEPATRCVVSLLAVPRLPFPASVFTREMRNAARIVANNLRNRLEVAPGHAPSAPAGATRTVTPVASTQASGATAGGP